MFTTLIASLGLIAGAGGLVIGSYALAKARAISDESQVLANRAAAVAASGVDALAVRDVAVLHYDALEEMSGTRSFSLALLNGDGDGVVLTSINGRTESRSYAKAIVRGEADILLSPEEYRVVRSARLGNGVGSGAPAPAAPADPVETAASTATVTGSSSEGEGIAAESLVTVLASPADADDGLDEDDATGFGGDDADIDADDAHGADDPEGSGDAVRAVGADGAEAATDAATLDGAAGTDAVSAPVRVAAAGEVPGGAPPPRDPVEEGTSARG